MHKFKPCWFETAWNWFDYVISLHTPTHRT